MKLTRMEKEVILEVGLFGKATTTNRTLKWPVSVVNVSVSLQVSRCREGFSTQVTFVGFVLKRRKMQNDAFILSKQTNCQNTNLAVSHPMVVEIGACGKSLSADGTLD